MIFEILSSVAVFKALGAVFIIGFFLLIMLNNPLKQSVPRFFMRLGNLLSQLVRSGTKLTPDIPIKATLTSVPLPNNTAQETRSQKIVQPTTAQQIERTAFNSAGTNRRGNVVPTAGQQSEITPIRSDEKRNTGKFRRHSTAFPFPFNSAPSNSLINKASKNNYPDSVMPIAIQRALKQNIDYYRSIIEEDKTMTNQSAKEDYDELCNAALNVIEARAMSKTLLSEMRANESRRLALLDAKHKQTITIPDEAELQKIQETGEHLEKKRRMNQAQSNYWQKVHEKLKYRYDAGGGSYQKRSAAERIDLSSHLGSLIDVQCAFESVGIVRLNRNKHACSVEAIYEVSQNAFSEMPAVCILKPDSHWACVIVDRDKKNIFVIFI